ncbi:hypothetical protein BJX66DRAFT_67625 [Aspergillus keveii]|uniref:Uncharacterized protein n=1 Tax=Aspergillus keveii TaxID=714993 RepID=A0ABR4FQ66_9EURO
MITSELSLRLFTERKEAAFLLKGTPEVGKLPFLAAMGILLSECGFEVLLVGSSNAAVEALTRELSNLDRELDYIHVRRGVAERQCLTTANLENGTGLYESLGAHPDHILPGLKAVKKSRDRSSEGDTVHIQAC